MEYKFRAWDARNNKWLLGYELPNLGGFSMKGEVMAFGEYTAVLSEFKLQDWDKLILMQFTGLHDKNGVEIYEGDVMDYGAGRYYPVVFINGSFVMEPMPTMPWLLPIHTIAGNIYQHPHLLKH